MMQISNCQDLTALGRFLLCLVHVTAVNAFKWLPQMLRTVSHVPCPFLCMKRHPGDMESGYGWPCLCLFDNGQHAGSKGCLLGLVGNLAVVVGHPLYFWISTLIVLLCELYR